MSQPLSSRSAREEASFDENITPMSHEEAMDTSAVEYYVLHDLSPRQELRFESHYFECKKCAQAVAVAQNLTMDCAQPAPEPWWRRLTHVWMVPAAAALLGLAVFQNFYSIPSLRNQLAQQDAPQPNTVITAHPILMGSEQGDAVKTDSITVELTLPPDVSAPFFRVELLGRGKDPVSQVVPAPQGTRLSLHVTRKLLGHRSYNVMVYPRTQPDSKDGALAGQYQFSIQ